jgi:hypothetical protein
MLWAVFVLFLFFKPNSYIFLELSQRPILPSSPDILVFLYGKQKQEQIHYSLLPNKAFKDFQLCKLQYKHYPIHKLSFVACGEVFLVIGDFKYDAFTTMPYKSSIKILFTSFHLN